MPVHKETPAAVASGTPAAEPATAVPAVVATAAADEVVIGPQCGPGDWEGIGYPETPDDEHTVARLDVATWGVSELKRYLAQHSVAIAGAVEKADLVQMVRAHQQGDK